MHIVCRVHLFRAIYCFNIPTHVLYVWTIPIRKETSLEIDVISTSKGMHKIKLYVTLHIFIRYCSFS